MAAASSERRLGGGGDLLAPTEVKPRTSAVYVIEGSACETGNRCLQ